MWVTSISAAELATVPAAEPALERVTELALDPGADPQSTLENVSHSISFPPDKQQYFQVRTEFPVASPTTILVMPNWTPGAYVIKNFAANVDRLSAFSETGTALKVEKISKDSWRVDTSNTEKLIVEYDVHTPTLSVQTSWVEQDFALINGASVFLYTAETMSLPQTVNVTPGSARGSVFSAMLLNQAGEAFQARDYDELVDSPVVISNAPAHRFSAGDQQYVFVNVGENASWDAAKATTDLAKLVDVTQSFWQINPLTRPYWFLNFSIGAKGGLEHDHSTVTMSGRNPMQNRDEYMKWLGLMSHEFFHAWNVRRLRPAALQSYEYQKEQYSSQLWLSEGFTSYYDNLILSRAELITPVEYLNLLAKDMHRLLNTPGRKLRPVSEASLESWTRHYVRNANTLNSTISYYNKGAIIAFVLDAYLRSNSKGNISLDDLMRKLYQRHSSSGFSPDEFMALLVDVGGPQAASFLQPLLNSTQDPDVDTALDWYGLEIRRESEAVQPGALTAMPAGFGVIWDNKQNLPLVKSVRAGSAGAKAGLLPGDEVLAIGDERMTIGNYASLMEVFRPGQSTSLLVSRRGQIKTLSLTLDDALIDHYVIAVQKRVRSLQLKQLEDLLGQDL